MSLSRVFALSLHDALPISLFPVVAELWQGCPTAAKGWAWPVAPVPTWEASRLSPRVDSAPAAADEPAPADCAHRPPAASSRSEEHTSELQSRQYLVCRLLL